MVHLSGVLVHAIPSSCNPVLASVQAFLTELGMPDAPAFPHRFTQDLRT